DSGSFQHEMAVGRRHRNRRIRRPELAGACGEGRLCLQSGMEMVRTQCDGIECEPFPFSLVHAVRVAYVCSREWKWFALNAIATQVIIVAGALSLVLLGVDDPVIWMW